MPNSSFSSAIRVFFGGSFDPIHIGHLSIIKHLYVKLNQQDVTPPFFIHILPTAGNPFKGTPTPANHRLAMIHHALIDWQLSDHKPNIIIDPYEIHQTPPVYTIDTVQYFCNNYPNDKLIFVMGADSLANLPTWKHGDQLLNHINIWLFDRQNAQNIPSHLSTKITPHFDKMLHNTNVIYQDTTSIITVSSSQIRHELRTTNSSQFISDTTLRYIKEHHLYT